MKLAVFVFSGSIAASLVVAACSSFTAVEEEPPNQVESGAPDAAAPEEASVDPAHLTTGCADHTREELFTTPRIAACGGSWGVPGIYADGVTACGRAGGNNGTKGTSCRAEDLCETGWHLCKSAADVGISGGTGIGPCAMVESDAGTFFATAQASPSNRSCSTSNTSDSNGVFGCGTTPRPDLVSCAPLNAVISLGASPASFFFAASDTKERDTATHGDGPGGVLCCRDD